MVEDLDGGAGVEGLVAEVPAVPAAVGSVAEDAGVDLAQQALPEVA